MNDVRISRNEIGMAREEEAALRLRGWKDQSRQYDTYGVRFNTAWVFEDGLIHERPLANKISETSPRLALPALELDGPDKVCQ